MLRYIVGIIVSLVVLTFVRAVWGIIQKAVVDEVKSAVGEETPKPEKQAKASPTAETTLRKCATCGTYKPEAKMVRYGAGAKSVYFCSSECEKKANG
jgi:hypothetical protein